MPVITDIEPVAVNVDATESNGLYPIREVSRLTGINPVTLRAWERRYGFIEPKRTNSGHRLYSVTDIETVRRVQGWIERGVSVSKVGELLARATPAISPHEGVQSTEYREWQLQISAALSAFNEAQLERVYGQIFSSYPPEVVFQDISTDFAFLTRSTINTKEKIAWADGKEYPLVKVEVSSHSHPFYTGKQKIVDTAGRVDRFRRKYGLN